MVKRLEQLFPGLASSSYRVTSPIDRQYNCIAWTVGDDQRWWWPGSRKRDYWPQYATRAETLPAFQELFIGLGYSPCADDSFEVGFEKIALFADPRGIPTHAARQLPNGSWTSKLGIGEDIEHTLDGLVGVLYGSVAIILKRPSVGTLAIQPTNP